MPALLASVALWALDSWAGLIRTVSGSGARLALVRCSLLGLQLGQLLLQPPHLVLGPACCLLHQLSLPGGFLIGLSPCHRVLVGQVVGQNPLPQPLVSGLVQDSISCRILYPIVSPRAALGLLVDLLLPGPELLAPLPHLLEQFQPGHCLVGLPDNSVSNLLYSLLVSVCSYCHHVVGSVSCYPH